MKLIRLTGATENSEGEPLFIDVSRIQLIATIIQFRRQGGQRKVTEVWVGEGDRSVKHVREHIDYVLRYWQYALGRDPDPRVEMVIPPPATQEFLDLAKLTYQPAQEAPIPTVKPRRRLFR